MKADRRNFLKRLAKTGQAALSTVSFLATGADCADHAARRSRSSIARRPTVPYVKVNPATGEFAEYPNLCPTPESLYNLCDLDWTFEHFKDEFQLKIILAGENIKRQTPQGSYNEIGVLAQARGIHSGIESPEELSNVLRSRNKPPSS